MHEYSDTIQRDGKWINVYGRNLPRAGQQLPGTPEYDTVDQAVAAAQARSRSFDTPKVDRYKQEYKQYMAEVEGYLKKVRNGRRVGKADLSNPRFSHEVELGRMGLPAGAQTAFAAPGTIAARHEKLEQAPEVSSTTSPVWGFHEPTLKASEGLGAFLGKVGEYVEDPRNAWIGMGPMSILGRGMRLFKGKPKPDLGGFRQPLDEMQKITPSKESYLDQVIGMNKYAESFNMNNPLHIAEMRQLEGVNPQLASDIGRTFLGRTDLERLKGQAFDPAMEGDPSPQVRRRFGFRK